MNRGVVEGALVQQVIGGSCPSWWNVIPPATQETPQLLLQPSSSASSASSASLSSSSASSTSPTTIYPNYTQPSKFLPALPLHDHDQDLPESWSQLLMGEFMEEEDRCSFAPFQSKRLENNWENVNQAVLCPETSTHMTGVKRENFYTTQPLPPPSTRSPGDTAASLISSIMLGFPNGKAIQKHLRSECTAECNSTSGPAFKKARSVQASPAQSPLKARKEKLGDRITALHQLVSPFGKTDTASVLLEAIGYIRFLQTQIQALSLPYLGGAQSNSRQSDGVNKELKDLRSRGLCLVPVSFTMDVDGDSTGADYWAPASEGEFR